MILAVNDRGLEGPAVCLSQWEEMKHDTRGAVKAPAHPLPENTSSRPPGNLHLTLTHARRGSGRSGGTLPREPETDRQPPPKKTQLLRVRPAASPGFTEPTPPGWTNFSRASSPRSASWCPRERRCSKVSARAGFPRIRIWQELGFGHREVSLKLGVADFARLGPACRARERRVILRLLRGLA